MKKDVLAENRPVLIERDENYLKKVACIIGPVDQSISKVGVSSSTYLNGSRKELMNHYDEEGKKKLEKVLTSSTVIPKKRNQSTLVTSRDASNESYIKRRPNSSSCFKTVERDKAVVYLNSNDKYIQTTPGQYDLNHSLTEYRVKGPRWFEEKEKETSIDEHYTFYLDKHLTTNEGKAPISSFKSKTGRVQHRPKFTYEEDFLDVGNIKEKLAFKYDVFLGNFEQNIDRNQAEKTVDARNKLYIHDLEYKVVNPDVYIPKLSNGVPRLEGYSDRRVARKGQRLNSILVNEDVENNPRLKLPNWDIIQHSDVNTLGVTSTDSKGANIERRYQFDKQIAREDTRGYKLLLFTPSAYFNALNASEHQQKRDADQEVERFKKEGKQNGESIGMVAGINAYNKTHRNIPFLCNMDKQKPRPEFIQKPSDWINLEYETEVQTSKTPRIQNITAMHKKRKKNVSKSVDKDENYKFYVGLREWDKPLNTSHDFSKDTNREVHKSASMVRTSKHVTDKFYDVNRGILEERTTGDPFIRKQIARDSRPPKFFRAQAKFVDYINLNETYEKFKHGQDLKKGFVDMKRTNPNRYIVTGRLATTVTANTDDKAIVPSVGTYNPKYDTVEPKSTAFTFSKS